MYNLDEVTQDLTDWILNTLSIENPIFGNMPPCPFAKKAVLENRLSVFLTDENTNYALTADRLKADNGKDVVAYIYDPGIITPMELTAITLRLNKTYPDLIFLEDHPDEIEKVQDFICNQGKYACIFAAERDGVLKAREYLKTTSYYNNWDEEYKQAVWSR